MIQATEQNLIEYATDPLTRWLISAAHERRFMSYGTAKRRLEQEEGLLSGDRVDVVYYTPKKTIAIEVKSRDSTYPDFERGLYQCLKYRTVMKSQDPRPDVNVESWLVTEDELESTLEIEAKRLGIRLKALTINKT